MAGLCPCTEGKFIWFFDHRFGSYHNLGVSKGRGGRGLPRVDPKELSTPNFRVEPHYWVEARDVDRKLAGMG